MNDVRSGNLDAIDLVKKSYFLVKEPLILHRAFSEGIADIVFWGHAHLTKDGGLQILESMLHLETDDQKKEELLGEKKYWEANYDSIIDIIYK